MESQAKSAIRLKFFDLLFGKQEGWLCLATTHPDMPKSSFEQKYFQWPRENAKIENFVTQSESKLNVYFCVNLLKVPQRKKVNCMSSDLVWADLDEVNPNLIKDYPPGIILRSSPNRWQAFWKLSALVHAEQAEEYSRRMTYHLAADKSGWDLTQLFRVPLTQNFKYGNSPEILLERALTTTAPPSIFDTIPMPPTAIEKTDFKPLPHMELMPSAKEVVYRYHAELRKTAFFQIHSMEPDVEEDWSKVLWRLFHICYEAGMNEIEVFAVAIDSACNKFERDGRPLEHLWEDVQRAQLRFMSFNIGVGIDAFEMPKLVEEQTSETFVDQYREWAAEATDAVVEFHNLGAFILLSAIVSGSVRIGTSYGSMVPNIWGLILGDSTLSRKTTSMRMVMDFLLTLDHDMIVATDGTAEGLLSSLASRPNKTSIFYKDEVSGFFDSLNRKEYLSGMPETLTALYDVPPLFSRKLRKESIIIESPAFIFFGGGVRDRVYETLIDEYIYSGFIPRFLIVSGKSDINKLRPTGPPIEGADKKREAILTHLSDVYEQYASDIMVKIGGQKVPMPPKIWAVPSEEAWKRYQGIEFDLLRYADTSPMADLALPTFERLTRSMLKMASILAAERQTPDKENQIKIEIQDVDNAAWYVQRWGQDSIDLITNSGRRSMDRMANRVLAYISNNQGVLKTTIMQNLKIKKKQLDEILGYLEDWELIRKEPVGRGHKFFTVT